MNTLIYAFYVLCVWFLMIIFPITDKGNQLIVVLELDISLSVSRSDTNFILLQYLKNGSTA
jgi:hypothetical protein